MASRVLPCEILLQFSPDTLHDPINNSVGNQIQAEHIKLHSLNHSATGINC